MARDKTELFISGFLILSVIFLAVNYDLAIASTLGLFILFSVAMFFMLPARITHNSKPKNTFNAIGWGLGAVVALLIVSLFLASFSGFLNVVAEPTLASIQSSGFSSLGIDKIIPQSSQPIFARSAFLTIFTFGVIIAAVETRMLGRAMEWLSVVFNVNLNKPNIKVFAIFFLLSGLFVWYHANAKGVVNNFALLITFLFAFASLEMIRRTKELEGATYFHMFNNLLYIIPQVQGQLGG